jgi:hypothetical protein
MTAEFDISLKSMARTVSQGAKAIQSGAQTAAKAVQTGIQTAAKAAQTGIQTAAKAAQTATKSLDDVPIVGRPLSLVYGATVTAPLQLANSIARGARLDQAVLGHFEGQLQGLKELAPYVQTVVTFVPGIGQGVGAAIGAGVALAEGRPLSEVVVEGIKGALPGGPIARAAFELGQAALTGQRIDEATLGRAALGALRLSPQQQQVLLQGLGAARDIASGKRVDEIVFSRAQQLLPPEARKALTIGIAVAEGQNLQRAVIDAVGPQVLAQLQTIGAQVTSKSPVLQAGLRMLRDPAQRSGYTIGAGVVAHQAQPIDLHAVRTKLKPAQRTGFDLAVAAYRGLASTGTSAPPPRFGASSRFGYYTTVGTRSVSKQRRPAVAKTIARNRLALQGAITALKQEPRRVDPSVHRIIRVEDMSFDDLFSPLPRAPDDPWHESFEEWLVDEEGDGSSGFGEAVTEQEIADADRFLSELLGARPRRPFAREPVEQAEAKRRVDHGALVRWAAPRRDEAERAEDLPPCKSRCGPGGPRREVAPPGTPPLVYRTGDPALINQRALRPAVGYAQQKLDELLTRFAAGQEVCPGLADPAARARFDALRAQLGRGDTLCVDCFFWDDTDRATRMFQLCRGLVEDGKIGPVTWAALETNPAIIVPPVIIDVSYPPAWTATRLTAATIDEYVHLLECVERAFPSLSPRDVLSLVRQIYYGAEPWSATQTSRWRDVITCGLTLPDPRAALGKTYDALRASQALRVPGLPETDVGHVFTGLEAMVCPATSVAFIPVLGNTRMSNEEVATWGGDIGSAAAARVRDEQDRGLAPKPWSAYIGGSGGPAGAADLRGDIDPFAIRAALTGSACSSSAMRALTLATPLSQVISEYYTGAATAVGRARASSVRCLVEALGGTVAGRHITNKGSLATSLSPRVEDFAWLFYLGSINKLGALQGRFPVVQVASVQATHYFLDWLEARL